MNRKRTRRGFTLIELLVVVAIIALLLAILMPGLQRAKKWAWMKICQSNARQVAVCLQSFISDNNDEMPRSFTRFSSRKEASRNGGDPDTEAPSWACFPRDINGTVNTNPVGSILSAPTKDDRIRGIEAGTIYPYYKDAELLHCPEDKRMDKSNSGAGYRSYSLTRMVNCWDQGNLTSVWGPTFQRLTQINNPSSKILVVEEADPRGWNWDSWVMSKQPGHLNFRDPLAYWHDNGCLVAYADGHAEHYVFKEKDTLTWLKYIQERALAGDQNIHYYDSTPGGVKLGIDNEDCHFFARGYIGN